MKRNCFLLLLVLLPLFASAEDKSGYVGDWIDLEIEYSSNKLLGDATWDIMSGPSLCVDFLTRTGTKTSIKIVTYFTETLKLRVKYQLKNGQNKYEYFNITCNPVTLNVTPASIQLEIGGKEYIHYTISPAGKNPQVSYVSSNKNVATVNSAGEVLAKGEGSAKIKVTNNMGPEVEILVTVGPNPGPNPDPDPDKVYEKTIEGINMGFWIESGYAKVSENCISSANGRVTIPDCVSDGYLLYSVNAIYNAAFRNISGLTELVIPNSVRWVQNNFVLGCQNLTSIVCKAQTPPQISTDKSLVDGDEARITLYVPEGCISKYKEANGWKRFNLIRTIGKENENPTLELSASPYGGTLSAGTKVYLTAKADGAIVYDADIYYTTDESTPTKNSKKYNSSGIEIYETCTLKAIAYKDGYETSDVLTVKYSISEHISEAIVIDATNFPDKNFRKYLLEQDYGNDGVISENEIKRVNSIYVENCDIYNLKGIEFFTELTYLNCSRNELTSLDVSNNSKLNVIYCYKNNIKGKEWENLINSLPYNYSIQNNPIYVAWSHWPITDYPSDGLTTDMVAKAKAKGWTPYYYSDAVDYYLEYEGCDLSNIKIDETNFPDANFRNYLLGQDFGKDGILTELEIKNITFMALIAEDIGSLKGIEYFTSLENLYCSWNSLGSLDLSKNTKLKMLDCYHCGLSSLDVSQNTLLETIDCRANYVLTSLDLSSNKALKTLYCASNNIKDSGMDNLINSLPLRSSNDGKLYVYSGSTDNNVCTVTQVATAKARGWIPYYDANTNDWQEYAGSDPSAIKGILMDRSSNTPIYNLNGQRLDKPCKGVNIIRGKKVVIR